MLIYLFALCCISIHALLAESDAKSKTSGRNINISIHALLAESDDAVQQALNTYPPISIHALLAESDFTSCESCWFGYIFLSTLSLRRATRPGLLRVLEAVFLSTLSLRRATSWTTCARSVRWNFYPRSPCGERPSVQKNHLYLDSFLSTLSLRRATIMVSDSLCTVAFLSTLSLRRATAKVHKTVGHFCAYETNFMEIASSC